MPRFICLIQGISRVKHTQVKLLNSSAVSFSSRKRTERVRTLRVGIAGFGGVGRATADLLLSRRERYRQVYETEVRLVAVCGSRSGLFDTNGLEADRFDTLEAGLSGPDFVEASRANVLIEAGPSDFRTGGPGLPYIRSALSAGHDTIVISKGAWSIADDTCANSRKPQVLC